MDAAPDSLGLTDDHKTFGLKLGRIGLIVVNYSTDIVTPDELAAHLFGLQPGEPITRHAFHQCIHPDDRDRIVSHVEDLISANDQDIIEFTHRLLDADGQVRWVHARKQLYREPGSTSGKAISAVAAVQDITERKKAEETAQYLLRELQHRTLNVATISSSLARMVYQAGAHDTFWERFEPRIRNLIENMRLDARGKRLDLTGSLQLALSPYLDHNRKNVAISGDKVALDAQQSQTLAMVFHELATNSLKYGALGLPDRELNITWRYETDSMVTFCWSEGRREPGPAPDRVGFGTQILEDFASMSLGGTSKRRFDDDRFTYELRFPVRTSLDDLGANNALTESSILADYK
ncbi:sensor histidine kinase [Erythrobacter sp. R86502]|uniref:sensor histidine kinase n=1 Tax=Erythrobacter sp. R86502 TaxID=3093846 RepID=UPI0036D2ED24